MWRMLGVFGLIAVFVLAIAIWFSLRLAAPPVGQHAHHRTPGGAPDSKKSPRSAVGRLARRPDSANGPARGLMISRRDVLKGAAAAGVWAAGRAHGYGWPQAAVPAGEPLVQDVDLFIGTGGQGVYLSGRRDAGRPRAAQPRFWEQGPDGFAGYHYSDTEIAGFSHTHLSGARTGDLCDILVTPTQAGADMPGTVTSPFSHDKEKASPGLLLGRLQAYDIRAELTATRRVGVHLYSFLRPAAGRQPAVSFDLGFAINRDEPVETQITLEGPTTIPGSGLREAGRRTSACSSRHGSRRRSRRGWWATPRATRPSAGRFRRSAPAACSVSSCARASRCS